jgi:hypothetical protein
MGQLDTNIEQSSKYCVVCPNKWKAYLLPRPQERPMFTFNRSTLGVCLAILVAAAPVLLQYL